MASGKWGIKLDYFIPIRMKIVRKSKGDKVFCYVVVPMATAHPRARVETV